MFICVPNLSESAHLSYLIQTLELKYPFNLVYNYNSILTISVKPQIYVKQ